MGRLYLERSVFYIAAEARRTTRAADAAGAAINLGATFSRCLSRQLSWSRPPAARLTPTLGGINDHPEKLDAPESLLPYQANAQGRIWATPRSIKVHIFAMVYYESISTSKATIIE